MAAVEPMIIKPVLDRGREYASITLTDELVNSRVLVLDGPVCQETCVGLIKCMLALERLDGSEPITLLISSPGGDVYPGLALIDVMKDLSCPVRTVAMGLVASMASVILASGDYRSAYPHAHILLHQVMSGVGMAQQSDFEIAAEHVSSLRQDLDELLAERCNLSAQQFHDLTDRDCWCDAERALELGLIDEIISRKTN